jgi:hypothetical protein
MRIRNAARNSFRELAEKFCSPIRPQNTKRASLQMYDEVLASVCFLKNYVGAEYCGKIFCVSFTYIFSPKNPDKLEKVRVYTKRQ